MRRFVEGSGRSRRPAQPEAAPTSHPFLAAGRPSRPVVTDLVWVGQRADLDHFPGWPPLHWYLQSCRASDDEERLALCDPVTGDLTARRDPPRDLPDTANLPPELAGAACVLWVTGTGQSRVSAAVHTVWYTALSRGVDAAVVVGLEPERHAGTNVAALGLGYRPLEAVG